MFDLSPFVAAFILGTESVVWTFPGNKETHVRRHLDVSMTRYTQILNALIDTELALQLDPVTTRRLQRVRDARQLSRSVRRSA
jgi:hypothetical protein